MRAERSVMRALLTVSFVCLACAAGYGQAGRGTDGERRRGVRSVTIPVTVRLPKERAQPEEFQYIEGIKVFEDGEQQDILTIRGMAQSPLTLAVLIQDDVVPSVGNEIKGLAEFVRRLPPNSRVLVGYMRAGSLQVRQKFTVDLERAAKSLRIPVGSTSVSPYNPFSTLREAVKRFEGQPVGRRAVLLVSDGLDLSHGVSGSTPTQSPDLQRAVEEAQRRGIAVYSIYAPTVGGAASAMGLAGNGQGALNRLATETGGHAYFQGTGAPVSFDPFLREVSQLLSRQFALTYLSTHPTKGFHRIRVASEMAEGEVVHPTGYPR